MPVAYDATADRPPWSALPVSLRAALAERLGGPVVSVRMARSGFTRGFAGVLGSSSGARVFVKASSIDYLVSAYRREALVTAALPAGVPAARPRWTLEATGWYSVGYDVIDGHVPALPWVESELSAALSAWAESAVLLGGWAPLLADIPDFSDVAQSTFVIWQEIAAHRSPVPAMPRYAVPHLDEMASLEARLPDLCVTESGVMHGDLRLDNVLVGADGRAWLCDWNHVCRGPAWFDTASLLVTAYASGLDADHLFATHPTVTNQLDFPRAPSRSGTPTAERDGLPLVQPDGPPRLRSTVTKGRPDDAAPAGALDASLAALAGLWLDRAGRPSDASPSIAEHQRWSGRVALAWLADRRGWPRPRPDDHGA